MTPGVVGEKATRQHADGAETEKRGQRDVGGRERTAIAAHQRNHAEIADPGIGKTEQHEEDGQHDDCRGHDILLRCRYSIDRAVGGAGVGYAHDKQQQRDSRSNRSGHDQGAVAAGRGDQRRHDGGRDRAAEESGKGMDRKRAAHARFIHMGRQDRIVGRMIDAVGKAQQRRAGDQPGIAQMDAEHDQGEAADGKPISRILRAPMRSPR